MKKMILRVTKRPATLSDEPKEGRTQFFLYTTTKYYKIIVVLYGWLNCNLKWFKVTKRPATLSNEPKGYNILHMSFYLPVEILHRRQCKEWCIINRRLECRLGEWPDASLSILLLTGLSNKNALSLVKHCRSPLWK